MILSQKKIISVEVSEYLLEISHSRQTILSCVLLLICSDDYAFYRSMFPLINTVYISYTILHTTMKKLIPYQWSFDWLLAWHTRRI